MRARPEVDHDALFVTKLGKPMGSRSFQYRVKKCLNEARVKGASARTLRHTSATHHMARGTALRTVQETLSHADLKTTSIYVQLAQEVTKRVAANAL